MRFDFSQEIPRENTSAVKLEMLNQLFGTSKVIPMWVADMDFATPPFIIDRLQKRLEHPILGYTVRSEEYTSSIANWLKNRFGWTIEHTWLSYCPGIVAGLNHAVQTFTRPRDKVMIQTPVYHPFFYAVKQNGRELIENKLIIENGKYKIDFNSFESQIKEGVKLFILCSPHNPIGRVWTIDELKQMSEICLRHKVLIVSDEIHADLIFDPFKHIPLASLSAEVANNTITFGSASKTFNIAGLSTAWAVMSNEQLLKRYNLQLERNGTWHGNIFGYEATIAAYSKAGEEWLAQLLQYIKGNVDVVREFLLTNLPKIKLVETEGTYLLWLDFREFGLSNDELNRLLINEAGLGLNKGETFGENGAGFQRMNVACPRQVVERALDQLKKVFSNL